MSLKDSIERKIAGDSQEQERRKTILGRLLDRFQSGGQDAVKEGLLNEMRTLENQFGLMPTQLENRLSKL